MIYLHGLGQGAESWRDFLACYKDDSAICPSLKELCKAEPADYNDLYKGFDHLCDCQPLPLHLCGLSLGAVLALDYATRNPYRIGSLVLIAPQFKMPSRLLRLQGLVFRLMPSFLFKGGGFSKADFISLTASMADIDLTDRLKELSCPVLIIYGEKDTANKSAAVTLSQMIKNSTLTEIEGAGHEVNTDAPSTLSYAISSFAKKEL